MLIIIVCDRTTPTQFDIDSELIWIQKNVVATVYNPIKEQTDSHYWITANMSVIDTINPLKHRWIAVSRDLEEFFPLGTEVEILNAGIYSGIWTINDRMNRRFKNRIDFLIGLNDKKGYWKDVIIRYKPNI